MYIIMTSSAQMPSSCWGRYANIAVVETDGEMPKMISTRAKHMRRIIREWPRCHVGTTERCEFRRAYAEAEKLLLKLREAEVIACL